MSQAWWLGAVLIALSCAGTRPTPHGSPPTKQTAISMPTASADPGVPPAAPAKPAAIEVTLEPIATTLSGEDGRAPCDFQRLYRGTIGALSLSAKLEKEASGSMIRGSIHRDEERPALPID